MRVLVTGAAGMLGRELVRQLAAAGARVRAHDRTPPDAAGAEAAEETLLGGLRAPALVERLVDGVDAMVHAEDAVAETTARRYEGGRDPGEDRSGLREWLHTADAAGAIRAAPDTTALQPTRELLGFTAGRGRRSRTERERTERERTEQEGKSRS